ncbi:MAG: thermonuclease family protein [Candidatus Njordarchaeia archaeon]
MDSTLIKNLKYIFILAVLFQLSCAITDSTFFVQRVIDGDTIVVCRDNQSFKVRLAEIDCPEKKQSFGLKAKQFLSKLILNRKVKVKIKTKDRYGRIIGIVFSQNKNINYLLVQQGLAWHYKKYSKNKFLSQLEEKARINKKGLWSQENPVPPWVSRKRK